MGDLTITGLDEEVLARLSRQAAEHGRSVEAEAAVLLRAEIARQSAIPTLSEEQWLAMAAEARRQTGGLNVAMVDLIREGRDER